MRLKNFHCYSHPALSGYFRVMGHVDGEYLVEWFTRYGTYQGNDYITDSGLFYMNFYEVKP